MQFDGLDRDKIIGRAKQDAQLQSQEGFEILKAKYHVLARYDKLQHAYNQKSGYSREKIGAELQSVTKKILANKQVAFELRKNSPAVLLRLREIQAPKLLLDR